ncbi:MAG: nucleotidyltransferase, partial [Pseudoflavonifractor sp.]
AVPEGRVKPWGTCHAVLAARHLVDGPFAVINSDDYYGPEAYTEIYNYLLQNPDRDGVYEYAMVGYLLKNTVSDAGSVARGICVETPDQYLASVTERVRIEKDGENARFTEDDGISWTALPGDTIVSLNLFGFTKSFLKEAEAAFPAFLERALQENPLKGEYFLPGTVSMLTESGKARVKVLKSRDKWYGVTYQADKPIVVAAIAEKTAEGLYPQRLWEAE